jgi:hypothetical protein
MRDDRTLGTITVGSTPVTLIETAYADGSLGIIAVEASGEPYGKLSVNLGRPLAPRHVAIKTWSENEQLAAAALASGLFEESGLTIPAGFAEAPVWRIRDEQVAA